MRDVGIGVMGICMVFLKMRVIFRGYPEDHTVPAFRYYRGIMYGYYLLDGGLEMATISITA